MAPDPRRGQRVPRRVHGPGDPADHDDRRPERPRLGRVARDRHPVRAGPGQGVARAGDGDRADRAPAGGPARPPARRRARRGGHVHLARGRHRGGAARDGRVGRADARAACASRLPPLGRVPHTGRALRGPARLPVGAALPRRRRAAHGTRRGRRRPARRDVPRRADVELPVAEGPAPGPRRRLPRDPARPRRLRPLRQADRLRLVLLRPPLRVRGHAVRGSRPARRDGRRARLGRPDRPADRGRAARSAWRASS